MRRYQISAGRVGITSETGYRESVGYVIPNAAEAALAPILEPYGHIPAFFVDGVTREIRWPGTRILAARLPESSRDLVLVLGPEPHLRWREYCDAILEVVSELGCELAVTFGSLLADAPHNRPVRMTGSTTTVRLTKRSAFCIARFCQSDSILRNGTPGRMTKCTRSPI